MFFELLQQWAHQARLSPPVVYVAEALEDAAHDVADHVVDHAAEWFELAMSGRFVFALLDAVDAAFDGLDWLLDLAHTFWSDCEQAGHALSDPADPLDPLDPRLA